MNISRTIQRLEAISEIRFVSVHQKQQESKFIIQNENNKNLQSSHDKTLAN